MKGALILGGGPAGTAAAIGLAVADVPHLLIERTRETGDALCGGFLSWRTLETLGALGVEADALNPTSVTRVRLFAGRRVFAAPLPRPAKGVSRHRLDTLMLARAEALGARVERGVGARAIEGGAVRLSDGALLTPEALFLASGKHDVRGAARPASARGHDPALGLRVRLPATPALARLVGDAVELHLLDRGYAGVVLQEDGSANLCLAVARSRMVEAGGPAALLRALGDELPALGERLAHGHGAIDAVANVPYGWRAREGVAGVFRLGDQAGVIPSLAGEGMGIAVASGARAAAAYAAGESAVGYQRRLSRDLSRPLAVAGAVRDLAERPTLAPAALALARFAPGLIQLVARATRVPRTA